MVAALRTARGNPKKGSPGLPQYDPARLQAAIATAGDAYALLLIATTEAFLREYLTNIAIPIGDEPKLATLIDRSVKALNARSGRTAVRADEKLSMHSLRVARNAFAHGHGRSVFPSVPKVQEIVSRFFGPFP